MKRLEEEEKIELFRGNSSREVVKGVVRGVVRGVGMLDFCFSS